MERRLSPAFEALNLQIIPMETRDDIDWSTVNDDTPVFVIKDVFTTRDGSWEPNPDDPLSMTDWARADYLLPWGHPCYFDDAGGDHHLFSALLPPDYEGGNVECQLNKEKSFHYFTWTDDGNHSVQKVKERSGWANIVIGPSSNFYPEEGQQGPWQWEALGVSDSIRGGGLPANRHISTFVVWQQTTWGEYRQGSYESLDDAIRGEADGRQCISLNPEAALQRAIAEDGFVPVENEFRYTWSQGPYFQKPMMLQKAEDLETGEARVYWCDFGNWETIYITYYDGRPTEIRPK